MKLNATKSGTFDLYRYFKLAIWPGTLDKPSFNKDIVASIDTVNGNPTELDVSNLTSGEYIVGILCRTFDVTEYALHISDWYIE